MIEVNSYKGKNDALTLFPLFYIIEGSPLEMLPEFLTSPNVFIRKHATIRQEVLMKEKACRDVID